MRVVSHDEMLFLVKRDILGCHRIIELAVKLNCIWYNHLHSIKSHYTYLSRVIKECKEEVNGGFKRILFKLKHLYELD